MLCVGDGQLQALKSQEEGGSQQKVLTIQI